MTLLRWSFLFLALSSTLSHLSAQTYYRGERTSVTQPSTTQDVLALRLSAEGFFRNDEYASDLVADYTLPGYRLQVDLGYSPKTTNIIGEPPATLQRWPTKTSPTGVGMGRTIPAFVSCPSSVPPSSPCGG